MIYTSTELNLYSHYRRLLLTLSFAMVRIEAFLLYHHTKEKSFVEDAGICFYEIVPLFTGVKTPETNLSSASHANIHFCMI